MGRPPEVFHPRLAQVSWIFVIVAGILFLQPFIDALPKHAGDRTWPTHALFHLTSGLGYQLALSIMTVLIARSPFRRGERWSWIALLVFMLGFATIIPAAVWYQSGPQPGAWVLISVCLVGMIVGLAMTWRPVFSTSPFESKS